ncbi:Elastin-binding protein ebpS [Cocos nucifera]|uniref:Elastin-binding protein ebpS n=1 Tax=Cocos nucifera TaxID=13894 RepID=A0A8K0NDY4_COCNU|nr:Elastin-binding protein ebpS [Cocos nucifera]
MGNSLRCCLACVLPCGALDLVRVVHLNGQVEEYSRQVSAGEILAANPNHVLSNPSSQGGVRQILPVSPDSELKRGNIYFLIPASSIPEKRKKRKHTKSSTIAKVQDENKYLADTLPEKKSGRRRSGRVGVWRPHLERIYEVPGGNQAWE